LKAAEEKGAAAPRIDDILRAPGRPDATRLPRPDPEGSTAAALHDPQPRSISGAARSATSRPRDRTIFRNSAAADARAMPGRTTRSLLGCTLALAMSHHTIREKERLAKLSEGSCDLQRRRPDYRPRGVGVGVALRQTAPASKTAARAAVSSARA